MNELRQPWFPLRKHSEKRTYTKPCPCCKGSLNVRDKVSGQLRKCVACKGEGSYESSSL